MTRPEWRVQGTKPLMYSHINSRNIHTYFLGDGNYAVRVGSGEFGDTMLQSVVAQSSMLGPRLFIEYVLVSLIFDRHHLHHHHHRHHRLAADDVQSYCGGRPLDADVFGVTKLHP